MAPTPDYNLTEDQAEVHAILTNIRMKILVTRCVLVAFFAILVFLFLLIVCIKSTWQDKTIIGVIEAVLSYTMYPLVKHYLPAVATAKAAEKRVKKSTAA